MKRPLAIQTVLVLEDDNTTREMLRQILAELLQVRVVESVDAEEALTLLGSGCVLPALVIVDLMLPGLDGESFMRALRVTYGPDLPIMVLSALKRQQVEESASRCEAQAVLLKPFELETFLREVRRCLGWTEPKQFSQEIQPARYGQQYPNCLEIVTPDGRGRVHAN